jgi:hypothetical protein
MRSGTGEVRVPVAVLMIGFAESTKLQEPSTREAPKRQAPEKLQNAKLQCKSWSDGGRLVLKVYIIT